MRFEQLRYLEAALRTGSFRQAAKELDISQPTITNQVQRLEEDLGVVLVVRGAKGVRPTYAAERILPHVVAAVQAEHLMREEASAIGGLKLGTVRLGTVPAGSQTILPGVVKRLLSDFPNVRFEVEEGPSRMVSRGVLSGHFDVGLVTRLAGIDLIPAEQALLHHVDLISGRLVLAVPENHRLASKDGFEAADLEGEPLIFPAETSILRTAFEQLLDGIEARIVYATNNAEASQNMVRAGVGICMANTLLSSTVSGNGVALVPLPFEWAHARISAIVRNDEARTSAVQAFLGLLRESAKNY
ncbi:LysR family transcriptional regulator [Rhodococcus sp. ACS1]|uniref:DNA-binding transcriptional regulator, LysR family n=3 Tax=Rhodococcus TaxID=1827 RepID=A0A1H4XQQ2_9NOCA|nr:MULTISPECIES: LysR family transcriptional regulator [Rhodococcus]MDF3310089.1 LysR family transcriptional regulator [Rhodococcus sp. T2V]PBC48356.1 LysR family transcriptional regulator [Rhodococcus sp. ACS1]QSE80163.1 LysR family transcriptional regulator [Rhodococcus koreensis]QYB06639.1 LysR family transcriptional regulator [Rhodococcus sp. USK10]SED08052.1 DNA-binding transcriptional regulator, LysR family [Rhodococcus koreensis]